jgi:ubiquinone/menaquinone biosynthesis C-methylase UbiE
LERFTVQQPYVHGYHLREARRLEDRAGTLVELLHADTHYAPGSSVLEAGCGVGAQTVTLAQRSPAAQFTSIDISAESVAAAAMAVDAAGLTNVRVRQADIFALPFGPASFDHVFVCFVLEHLPRPVDGLVQLNRLLRQGGAGGNALIGRQLYPLMIEAGLQAVRVSPRMVYVDASRPDLVDGFTRKTFTAMIDGVRETAVEAGLVAAEAFDAGIRDLRRTAQPDGVFCYTFFKGTGFKGTGEKQQND